MCVALIDVSAGLEIAGSEDGYFPSILYATAPYGA